jgi:signal transduction histidine kinase
MKRQAFLRQHGLWVGFLAVLVPLLVIVGLQYRSLVALEKTSVAAHRGILRSYLEAIATDVARFYRTTATSALQMLADDLVPNAPLAGSVCAAGVQGAQFLFTAFVQEDLLQMHFYDPTCRPLASPPAAETVHAIKVALAPWKLLSKKGIVVEAAPVTVDERDPEHRLLLKPVTDAASRVIGVAGMLVDTTFFTDNYLPRVIHTYLPQFFPDHTRQNVIVTVRNGSNRLVLATQPLTGQDNAVWIPFLFLFTDWRLGTQSRYLTPEQWARRHFAVNVSLAILMTLVLIAGIVLALRTASHAMQLSQMQTDFVSNVSHELRTPLASIRVFGEFLRLGRFADLGKVREYGEYIEAESRRLTQLINNILDFSKIESGQKTYQVETVEVGEMVAEVLKTFDVRMQQRAGQVVFEAPDTPVPPVLADPDAIAQAVANLLDNAIKYSPPESDIHIRLGQQDGYVTIAVRDHGIGIPREEQTRIFERFHRVSTGFVHNVKGSGLGLAIVKHVVEAHRGRVTLESAPGQGSTFTLHLPVVHAAHVDTALHAPGDSAPQYEASTRATAYRLTTPKDHSHETRPDRGR